MSHTHPYRYKTESNFKESSIHHYNNSQVATHNGHIHNRTSCIFSKVKFTFISSNYVTSPLFHTHIFLSQFIPLPFLGIPNTHREGKVQDYSVGSSTYAYWRGLILYYLCPTALRDVSCRSHKKSSAIENALNNQLVTIPGRQRVSSSAATLLAQRTQKPSICVSRVEAMPHSTGSFLQRSYWSHGCWMSSLQTAEPKSGTLIMAPSLE